MAQVTDTTILPPDKNKEELLETLANSIESKFVTRSAQRAAKENQWLRSAALYYGKLVLASKYTNAETPFERGMHTNRPDVNVVRAKCSIAIAQTVSVQFGTSNKNWDIFPDKTNDDPNAIEACSKMSAEIEAQLEESKYAVHARKAMWDRVVLGTGILKGPNSAGKLVRSYNKIAGTTTWTPAVSVDYSPVVTYVNPWFFYPDETTDEAAKLNDTIEAHPMSPFELKKYMKHEGFDKVAIARVLEKKPEEYKSSRWADFAKISENTPNIYKNKYVILEYHGPVTKSQLDTLSIEPNYDSINDEYYGEVWACQGEIIRVELEAIEASFCVPYYISVWEKDPGSVFGFGVPLMMEDAQRVVNESWHMILDNSAISSGPQVAMQKHLIEPASGKWELGPRAIWYLNDPQATVDQAIQFFNVPNVTQQIVPIMQMAMGFAEDESGIPMIAAGLSSPEATETATGALMMHQASTTLLDFMSEEWDDTITEPVIQNMYAWNMQNSLKDDIKGSYCVDVRTSTQYKNKQLHIRDLEKLSVESAQNPNLAKWLNQDILTKMRLEMMNLPSRQVIKNEDQVKADQEAAAKAPPPPEMVELQLKARKQSLDEAQLAFQMKQGQQQDAYQHEEKMMAEQTKLMQAQAEVAVSQNNKETQMLKMQQNSQDLGTKLASAQQIARENNQTQAFLKSMEETRKQQEADAYALQVKLEAINKHNKNLNDATSIENAANQPEAD